jgi:hypothetical protein
MILDRARVLEPESSFTPNSRGRRMRSLPKPAFARRTLFTLRNPVSPLRWQANIFPSSTRALRLPRTGTTTKKFTPKYGDQFGEGRVDPKEGWDYAGVRPYSGRGKSKTLYSLPLRRSTRRFTETWEFPVDDTQKTQNRSEGSGHCASFTTRPTFSSQPR